MKVPSFMLKKLYVAGSLEPDGEGFQFKMKNTLATATITEPPSLVLDGEPVSGDEITFVIGDEVIHGKDVSDDDTFELTKGAEVVVKASRPKVEAGSHKLRIKVESKEWDTIEFEVEDTA